MFNVNAVGLIVLCTFAAACSDQESTPGENAAMQTNFRGPGLHKGNTIIGSYDPNLFTEQTAIEAVAGSCLQMNGNGGDVGLKVQKMGTREDFFIKESLKTGWTKFKIVCTSTGLRRPNPFS